MSVAVSEKRFSGGFIVLGRAGGGSRVGEGDVREGQAGSGNRRPDVVRVSS